MAATLAVLASYIERGLQFCRPSSSSGTLSSHLKSVPTRGLPLKYLASLFSRLRLVGREAEEGVNDLLSRLVVGGLDHWPDPAEAWGELDNCRELLDFKGWSSVLTVRVGLT